MNNLCKTIETAWPPVQWIDVHVVVAVSGGADSMALLRGLMELKQRFGGRGSLSAAHVNHGLRPSAADDEAWLVDQFHALGIDFSIARVDASTEASRVGDGIEAAARSLRYQALLKSARTLAARYVVTGHTADDQIETVLHRILRGTGIDGLTGIPTFRELAPTVSLARPMLDVSRRQVLDYLAEVGQSYREDPTNQDTSYTRNRLRHELLPLLRDKYNAKVDEALLRLIEQAREWKAILRPRVSELVRQSATISHHKIELRRHVLAGQPDTMVREVIRAAWRMAGWPEQQMTAATWRKFSSLLHANSIRADLPGGVEIEVSRDIVRLVREKTCRA